MRGVDASDLEAKIRKLVPGYMAMGHNGMHEMAEMTMPGPTNTAPMMTGEGPFGPVAMGGMFSVLKVRRGPKRGDYAAPELVQAPARRAGPRGGQGAAGVGCAGGVEVQVRKPGGHAGHQGH
jgi:hypothetical protein